MTHDFEQIERLLAEALKPVTVSLRPLDKSVWGEFLKEEEETMLFEIEHDLVDQGGVDVVEYYITAENTETGEVLRHAMTFRSHELFCDPRSDEIEIEIVERPAGEAEREAQAMLAAVRKRGTVDRKWWYELVPGGAA